MKSSTVEHVSSDAMESFLRVELPRNQAARLVRHLLTRCPRCLALAETGRRLGLFSVGQLGPAVYANAFHGLQGRPLAEVLRIAQERLQGIGLLAELERYPPEQRSALVRSEPRFHHWGLFDRILVGYQHASREEPRAGVELVKLALVVLDELPHRRYPPPLLADFRAAALAALGNAQRLAGSFSEAEAAFASAYELLGSGTGDPLEEANVFNLEASLRLDLGEFERSVALLDDAIRIYREVDDAGRRAHALVKQAYVVGYLDPKEGIARLQDALRLLDPAQEPRLELCARHNLAWFLNDAGEPEDALSLLELSRPLYAAFADSWTRLRLHWLEGRIARSLGDLSEAEAVFHKVRLAFEQRGMHFEQTLISIDLVEVLSAQDKLEAAARLAIEFEPLLRSWGMHDEGRAMWVIFRDRVREHAQMRVSAEEAVFRGITAYFHRAWRQPMRFGGPAAS